MGVQNDSPNKYVCPKVICEGSVERSKPGLSKLDIVIGKSWKRLYMVLSTDGLRFYKSKFHYINGKDEKEVIPICHIKSTQAFNPDSNQRIKVDFTKDYFQVETQRDVVVVLRTNKEKVSWPALIQIELIKYKVSKCIDKTKLMFNIRFLKNYFITEQARHCSLQKYVSKCQLQCQKRDRKYRVYML